MRTFDHPIFGNLSRDFNKISLEEIKLFLQKYGDQSHSYFHMQPGVRYFHIPEQGFVAFYNFERNWCKTKTIVFGNPVCAKNNLEKFLQNFLSEYPNSIFLGIQYPVSKILESVGYVSNEIGLEHTIDLSTFSIFREKMRYFRKVSNRHDYLNVKELDWRDVDENEVFRISQSWLATKRVSKREFRLLSRPPVFSDEWKVRKFFCYQGDYLLGFIFFDPYFFEGHTLGYCANILRSDPKAKKIPVLDFCMLKAIEKFQSEKIPNLALGLSPFHKIEKKPDDRRIFRWMMQTAYRYEICYNFRKLAFHKARYRANNSKLYCSIRGNFITTDLYALLKSTNMF